MIPLKDDNPTSKRPIVSYGIVGFCVLIFFAQLGLSDIELRNFTYSYGLIPSVLMGVDQLPSDLSKISPIGTIFTSCTNAAYLARACALDLIDSSEGNLSEILYTALHFVNLAPNL